MMADRFNRYLFDEHGRARGPRMLITALALLVLALAGSVLFVVMALFLPNPPLAPVWLVLLVVLLKLPLIAFCGWLIFRNKEIPGVPVVWGGREVREILDYITAQARASLTRPDVGARLAYLSREAWHVVDQAEGTLKADAVGVALEIDRLAAEHGVHRMT
jgi:hypothetical protein